MILNPEFVYIAVLLFRYFICLAGTAAKSHNYYPCGSCKVEKWYIISTLWILN